MKVITGIQAYQFKGGRKMKIEEFKEEIDSIGFYNDKDLKVTEDHFDFCVQNGSTMLATVSKSTTGIIDTNYQWFAETEEGLRKDLFDVIYKFASTSIPEREEQKRYIIPLPNLVTTDGEQQYLTHNGSFFASRRDKKLRQTWKEEHLKYIPEEYRKYAVEVEE